MLQTGNISFVLGLCFLSPRLSSKPCPKGLSAILVPQERVSLFSSHADLLFGQASFLITSSSLHGDPSSVPLTVTESLHVPLPNH